MVPPAVERERLAIVMVGLPARGKTFLARKMGRYLSWLGYRTRTFNVGEYRRDMVGAKQPAGFFSAKNDDGERARLRAAMRALNDLLSWFAGGGEVGIYDATNTTRARRDMLHGALTEAGVQVIFVESICMDDAVVEANVRETKLKSPDYAGIDPDEAVRDFEQRIANYQERYEPVDDDRRSYVKLIDVGRSVVTNRIHGYLASRLVFFLMNVHDARRRIWLTRHGESEYNVMSRIGGDSGLTARGWQFADSLAGFFRSEISGHAVPQGAKGPLLVWTSTLQRTRETASRLPVPHLAWRALDEIDAGVCEGMTYEDIARDMPEEHRARLRDKYRYRYPRGESYIDVIQRLEPVIVELERQRTPTMIIGHQAVLRALYGYLLGKRQAECPFLELPLHTVVELTPNAYGYEERRIELAPAPESRLDAPALSMS